MGDDIEDLIPPQYMITLEEGSTPCSSRCRYAHILFGTFDDDDAWEIYSSTHPEPSEVVALWDPDGTLLASKYAACTLH